MEEKGGGFALAISSLVVLLTVLGVGVFKEPALRSNRPLPPKLLDQSFTEERVPARLWQDPFAAVQAEQERLSTRAASHATDKATEFPIVPISDLQRARSVTILAVTLSGEPYSEASESRIRTRYAVLSALDVAGYTPHDGSHLGCFAYRILPSEASAHEKPAPAAGAIPIKTALTQPSKGSDSIEFGPCEGQSPIDSATSAQQGTRIVPYEWFFPPPANKKGSAAWVLWLNDDAYRDAPLEGWSRLLRAVARHRPLTDKKVVVRVIGPHSSDGIVCMIREMTQCSPGQPAATYPDDFEILSPSATAEDREVLAGAGVGDHDQEKVAHLLGERVSRTIADAKAVAESLAGELEERGLDSPRPSGRTCSSGKAAKSRSAPGSASQSTCRDEKPTRADGVMRHHVVLLAEWDTFYGRSLPLSMARALTRTVLRHRGKKDGREEASPERVPTAVGGQGSGDAADDGPSTTAELYGHQWIHYYSYMRGLDGETPSGADAGTPRGDQNDKKTQAQPLDVADRAEGEEQLDYVRRLSHELLRLEWSLQAKGNRERIFAIGILGSDLHDKLLIL